MLVQITAVWPGFDRGSLSSMEVPVWSWGGCSITVEEAAASLVVQLFSMALGHPVLKTSTWRTVSSELLIIQAIQFPAINPFLLEFAMVDSAS